MRTDEKKYQTAKPRWYQPRIVTDIKHQSSTLNSRQSIAYATAAVREMKVINGLC